MYSHMAQLSEGVESMVEAMRNISRRLDGAYSLALLNARGDMLVARDPLGIKPLCYAVHQGLFAAASESVALLTLGFETEQIRSLAPGHAILVDVFVQIFYRRHVHAAGSAPGGPEVEEDHLALEVLHC